MAFEVTEECVACGICLEECPEDAIEEGDIYSINNDDCIECGICVDECPTEAIIEE